MSQNPNLLSLSHLEDACGHLVFKNFAFQTSHLPCLCIQRNRWWKPQEGKKPAKYNLPRFQHSPCYNPTHTIPRMAFKRDRHFASGQTRPGHSVICIVTPEPSSHQGAGRLVLLEFSASTQCLGHFHANCVFFPRRKVLTALYLTSLQFCGSWRLSLPACLTQGHKNLSTPHNCWSPAEEARQGLSGGYRVGRVLQGIWMMRLYRNCYTKGILELVFSMKRVRSFHFLPPSVCFSFLHSFFFQGIYL